MSTSADTEQRQPASLWLRVMLALGCLIVLLLLLGLVWSYRQQAETSTRVKGTLARLEESDPGWKLEDIEAARIDPVRSRNSALIIQGMLHFLPRHWPRQEVLDTFQEVDPPYLLSAAQQALLEKDLAEVAAEVKLARGLASMDFGRFPIDYGDNPLTVRLDEQQSARRVALLLQYDALRLAHKGDMVESLRSARGIFNAGRSVYDEPILISQLIRVSCIQVAATAVEHSLAMGEVPDEPLKELQTLLVDEEKHPTLTVGYRGERALLDTLWNQIMRGKISSRQLFLTLGPSASKIDGLSLRTRLLGLSAEDARREYPLMLDLLTRFVDASRLPAHQQAAALAIVERDGKALFPTAPLLRLLLPGVTQIGKATRRKTASVSCLRVLLAVERYRLANKKWPERLEELSKELLPEIPLDPHDGKPLRYQRLADGVIVYSVGPDGVDNGGLLNRRQPNASGSDQGFRLWDVDKRRQPPVAGRKPPEKKP